MSPGDVFLLAVRWLHVLAAVAWVGGSLFYLLALRPALRKGGQELRPVNDLVGMEFRAVVDTCVVLLVLTGVVLAFGRLTSPATGIPYVATLGVKVVLALWMFALAWGRRRARQPAFEALVPRPEGGATAPARVRLARALTGANLIAILGVAVFLLSELLRALFENSLGAR
jgi:uncharacterized membrane protein